MTRDEYLIFLATEPATPSQRGRIMAECARLGIDDRAERLAICAEIAGLGVLGSTRDLVQGDAGRIVRALQDCPDRAGLPTMARTGDQDQAGDGERGPTLARAIVLVLAVLIGAWQDRQDRRGQGAAEPEAGGD